MQLHKSKPPVQDTDVIRKFSKAPHGCGAYERKLPKDTDVVRKFSKAPHGRGAYERKLPKLVVLIYMLCLLPDE